MTLPRASGVCKLSNQLMGGLFGYAACFLVMILFRPFMYCAWIDFVPFCQILDWIFLVCYPESRCNDLGMKTPILLRRHRQRQSGLHRFGQNHILGVLYCNTRRLHDGSSRYSKGKVWSLYRPVACCGRKKQMKISCEGKF